MITVELKIGRIYFLNYGGNTQVVGRLKLIEITELVFFSLLHYWNGFETYRDNDQYCVISGITELREATKPEKHVLVQKEIEHETL